ncbi:MAG: DUF502 domain-containing protein, partial [Armatimonadetes bacterium]|nr:DUF502 domain-containing protein [Armatimonadota bacterium]MDW8122687.1 DUF502 domain-containing protein [Armatimonadota bacterium]
LINNSIGRPIDNLISDLVGRPVVGVGFLTAILLVLTAGFVFSTVVGRRLFALWERLILQVPLLKTVYPAAKQVVEFFISPSQVPFSSVVLVPHRLLGYYVIGFVTSQSPESFHRALGKRTVNVFIPFTPTPVTGIMVVVPEDEVIAVDLSVEDALKMVVSGGVVSPASKERLLFQETKERSGSTG